MLQYFTPEVLGVFVGMSKSYIVGEYYELATEESCFLRIIIIAIF